ncbi:hypothetical protein HDA40_000649 [Hamadaea flava]|uniref:Uncharacterized protein n=1 Tax=Hamadaea flava TaxID=1742688 RepID=A0ABV8M0F4_9ACTN|nr:hypothetical protein [Hamadaea flava]MCP2322142.1 hypothetical protein [Hamadaea flava]
MHEAFASTVAQLLPVFALAALVELIAFSRQFGRGLGELRAWSDLPPRLIDLGAIVLGVLIIGWLEFDLVRAEMMCLDALVGRPVPLGAANEVRATVVEALVYLIAFPVVGVVLQLLLRISLRAMSLTRTAPSTLDSDPVALGLLAEDHVA